MNKWWHFRFRINWPENQFRQWIDILIFDTIVRQILIENRKKISLWRVHRRAVRDQEGHQFTFLCYSQNKTAQLINKKIISSSALIKLKNAKLLEKYFWEEEERDKNNKTNIEDTSDKDWPIEIQRSWPFFIMGVSEMLLELIEQIKENTLPPDLSIPINSIESYYSKLNNRLSYIWQYNGQHAFFHHINALFGYVPLLVKPRTFSGIIVTL